MYEHFKQIIQDPRSSLTVLFLGLALGASVSWVVNSYMNEKIIKTLETQKSGLDARLDDRNQEIKELKNNIISTDSKLKLSEGHRSDCNPIKNMITDKIKELRVKENEVSMASPVMVDLYSNKYKNPLYARKLDELSEIQKQINALNKKLIECI